MWQTDRQTDRQTEVKHFRSENVFDNMCRFDTNRSTFDEVTLTFDF